MMKKYVSIVLLFWCLIGGLATGCAKKGNSESGAVNVDLTRLSSTMIYAELENILLNPDDYIGKTIKINGIYNYIYYDDIDRSYHYVVIEDDSECCQQGLEFIRKDNQDMYPKEQMKIEVVGVLESYEGLDQSNYRLVVDDISILK